MYNKINKGFDSVEIHVESHQRLFVQEGVNVMWVY